jgi:hypothetical protein
MEKLKSEFPEMLNIKYYGYNTYIIDSEYFFEIWIDTIFISKKLAEKIKRNHKFSNVMLKSFLNNILDEKIKTIKAV